MASQVFIIGSQAIHEALSAAAALGGTGVRARPRDIDWLDVNDASSVRAAVGARCIVIDDSATATADREPLASVLAALASPKATAVVLSFSGAFDAELLTSAHSAGVARERLLGTGTVALSAEFRRRIAARLKVHSRDVHALIVGGEGESAVPLWSSATIAGIPVHQWAVMGHGKMTVRDRIEIFVGAKESFADPTYALSVKAIACLDIVEAILADANRVLPVARQVAGYRDIADAWLALPCIVNARGAEPPLEVPMNDAEIAGLRQAAESFRISFPGTPGRSMK